MDIVVMGCALSAKIMQYAHKIVHFLLVIVVTLLVTQIRNHAVIAIPIVALVALLQVVEICRVM
jgi:hypothetical protein